MGEDVTFIKRWAFYPLLALICLVVGANVGDRQHENMVGMVIGLVASVPLAFVIDRRRQRQRSAGLRP